MDQVRLSDGVVVLTPFRVADIDAHLAGEDDQLVRWLNGGPSTRAGTEEYVRRCTAQWLYRGPARVFGIRTGPEPVLAGTIDLRFAMPRLGPGQVNIAYGLYPAWRGRGLATRAVHLVCRYAAQEGASEGVIRVDPENTASAAVARRAGFRYSERVMEPTGNRLDWYLRELAAVPAEHPVPAERPVPAAGCSV
ncbi:GNAT family N-acetyltransferase [Kitasatospora purpeofusca]|uniref:GNAT family N-acetyltransferase n=1 Tax=Kitasatospora purpeofusca TaxID=67352 RepID=UPI002258ACE9|nr:GNAT family N-acetyltransferase [Kitasatospora purpeofusca]MCX4684142.1 GNAT family N-acetyltransferase [Kitasatospora purpeofusca]MCX4758577.1 GNAT family N-acetyltransferase [Kitasatospora purpeofusca]WSR30981.1 GNAT family N-acetyltransferase [Kitasatospora purpeofusca]WSR39014.1 GNAT family N-acetyltransferase [Kitasatospora purpeofusca]